MPPRQKRRDQWQRTKKRTWTISLGSRGQRIKLFQNCKNGFFYRSVYLPGVGKNRRSLGTKDRAEAETLGRQLLAQLTLGYDTPNGPRDATVRLGDLCSAFIKESPMLADNVESGKAEVDTRAAILCAVIGSERDVRTLTPDDILNYSARRKAGGIPYEYGKVTAEVRQRAVQADIKFLKQALRWACTRTMPDGGRWLTQHPLQFVEVKGETDIYRPVASFERFEATRVAMVDRQTRYAEEVRKARTPKEQHRAESRMRTWIRAELALVLLEATGKRRGTISQLRWSDFDSTAGKVTYRPESEKKRKTWVVDYPREFFEIVREFQKRLGVAGGCLFPRGDDDTRSTRPELLSQWIQKAENDACLPKLKGGLCHPYRRKWRSERNHHPTKAVMQAGGWSDVQTMTKCYDHPEADDILAVTSEPRKRRERAASVKPAVGGTN